MAYAGPFAFTVPEGGTGHITLTNHGVLVGAGTSAVTSLSVGTNGQVLVGSSSADPSFITPTAGSGLSITTNATTLSYAISAPVSIANGGTNATSMATTDGIVYFDGTRLVTTAAGTNGQVLLGATSAAAGWVTPTAGSGLSITTNSSTLSYAISAPVSIANGGTNATSMATTDGVVYYDGTRLVTTAVGTATYVLTSNGSGNAPTFQASGGGGGGITTLDGDSGSATGSTVTIAGTSNEITTSATSATVTLSIPSTFIAPGSIEATTSITADSGAITATAGNVVISAGQLALTTPVSSTTGMITYDGNPFIWQYPSTHSSCFFGGAGNIANVVGSGNDYNIGIGYQAFHTMGGGEANIGIGYQALYTGSNTGGNFQYNVAVGYTALNSITTGSKNIGIGYQAGTNYASTESSNIVIGNTGTASESNVIRIGTQGSGSGQQNTCYIAGITGVTVTGTAVLCSTAGLLGTVVSSERFKENIKDMSSSSDKVMSLRPVTFNFIDGKGPFGDKSDSKSTQYGLIAEEVAEIMPDLVVFDEGLPHSVKYHDLPAMLLNEIQKLVKRVEYLEDQLKGWEEQ